MKNEKHLNKKLILIICTTLLVLLVLGAVAIFNVKINKNKISEEIINQEDNISNVDIDQSEIQEQTEINKLEMEVEEEALPDSIKMQFMPILPLKEISGESVSKGQSTFGKVLNAIIGTPVTIAATNYFSLYETKGGVRRLVGNYTSLGAAIAASSPATSLDRNTFSEITLLTNYSCYENSVSIDAKQIMLNLNGYSFTTTINGSDAQYVYGPFNISNRGKLEIMDNSIQKTGALYVNGTMNLVGVYLNDGDFQIDGGKMVINTTGSESTNSIAVYDVGASSLILLNGGTIEVNEQYGKAYGIQTRHNLVIQNNTTINVSSQNNIVQAINNNGGYVNLISGNINVKTTNSSNTNIIVGIYNMSTTSQLRLFNNFGTISITSYGNGAGILGNGIIEMEGGSIRVNSTSNAYGIQATIKAMSGGNIDVTSSGANAYGLYIPASSTTKKTTISGGTINVHSTSTNTKVYGVYTSKTQELEITNSSTKITATTTQAKDAYGVWTEDKVTITGGTITGDAPSGWGYGLIQNNNSSQVIIGTSGSNPSQTDPCIIGTTNGVTSNGAKIYFYDGIFKGKLNACNAPQYITPEVGYVATNGIESSYKTLTLQSGATNAYVSLTETKGSSKIVKYYNYLEGAFKDLSNSSELASGTYSEIKLLKSITVTTGVTIKNTSNVKFDLNNCKATFNLSDDSIIAIRHDGGTFEIIDNSSQKTGTIDVTGNVKSVNAIYIVNGTFKLTNGIIKTTNSKGIDASATTYTIGIKSAAGVINIAGGEVSTTGNTSQVYGLEVGTNSTINITNGKINVTGTGSRMTGAFLWCGESNKNSLVMSAGNITVNNTGTGTDNKGIWANNANSTVNISGGTIDVNGVGATGIVRNGNLSLTGGTIKATAKSDTAIGITNFSDTTSGTINLNGSYKIEAKSGSGSSYGVQITGAEGAKYTLTINKGNISSSSSTGFVYGIYLGSNATFASQTIDGVTISASSSKIVYGIYNAASRTDAVKVSNANITSTATESGTPYGIYSKSPITTSGGTVISNSSAGTANGVYSASATNVSTTKTNVKVTSQTGSAYGITGGNKTISGGRIEVTSNSGDAKGIDSFSNGQGTSTLKDNYELIVTANKGRAWAVYQRSGSGETFTLTGGTITAKASGTFSFGVYIEDNATGTMTINGTTITSTGTSDSCEAYGVRNNVNKNVAMNITNANITATSIGSKDAYGIRSQSQTVTSGGTITCNTSAGIAYGIRSNGLNYNLSTTKTNVKATSQTGSAYGIQGGSRTISGGKIEVTSNSGSVIGINSFSNGQGTTIIKDSYEIIATGNKAYGIYQRSGSGETFTINDGKITATATGTNFSAGVYIADSATGSTTINLSSGTIKGRNGIYATSPNSPLSINITGGNVNGVGAYAITTESGVQGNIRITNGQATSDKVNAINIGEGGKVNLDISGGTIKTTSVTSNTHSGDNAISDYGTGTINVSGGTIIGSFAGIGKYRTGNITITNGNISGSGHSGLIIGDKVESSQVTTIGTSGSTTGPSITSTQWDGIANYAPNTVTIYGGTFSGPATGFWNGGNGTVKVEGGTFTSNLNYGIWGVNRKCSNRKRRKWSKYNSSINNW